MIDQHGNVFDCKGRYTSEEITNKFGGRKALQSLSKNKPSGVAEQINTINLARIQDLSVQSCEAGFN